MMREKRGKIKGWRGWVKRLGNERKRWIRKRDRGGGMGKYLLKMMGGRGVGGVEGWRG